jgi:3-oxoacyl-[acyl-carrier-protein] synthase III
MQDATATLTSSSKCLKMALEINAFIGGKRASCIDLDGACSTFVSKRSSFYKTK